MSVNHAGRRCIRPTSPWSSMLKGVRRQRQRYGAAQAAEVDVRLTQRATRQERGNEANGRKSQSATRSLPNSISVGWGIMIGCFMVGWLLGGGYGLYGREEQCRWWWWWRWCHREGRR